MMRRWWQRLRPWLALYAPMVMLAWLTPMANFLSNRYQVSAQNVVLPLALCLVLGAIVTAVFYRFWRRDPVGGYVAGVAATMVLSSNFDNRLTLIYPMLQAVLPLPGLGAVEAPVFSLIFAALIAVGAYWLGRLVSRLVRRFGWKVGDAVTGVTIAISVTFAFQMVPLAADLVTEWPQFFYKPAKIAPVAGKAAVAKPDIYYIVLDRYASQDVLSSQFGYDNSEFMDFLKSDGYYVNPSAHNNYPYTTMSIASTMTGDYLNDIIGKFGTSSRQTVFPYHLAIRNSAMAQTLKDQGYSYQVIGNWYETSNVSPVADKIDQQDGKFVILGQTFMLDNFPKNILLQSPFARLIQAGPSIGSFQLLHYTSLSGADLAKHELQSLRTAVAQPTGGRFIFAHILVPHDPYEFNADGSLNPNSSSDNVGEPIKQKYVNQVKFISGQMKDILSQIKKQSHDQAVVVLQSDEGPYPAQINHQEEDMGASEEEINEGDMRNWSTTDLKLKYGNLAAYRVPQADLAADASAADSVNIFRLVLNTYFQTGLPYLPDCYYALPDGKNEPLTYADITQRLSGQPADTRCANNGTVKP